MLSWGDVLAGVGRELEVLERDTFDRALDRRLGDGGDVEQGGRGQQRQRWGWACGSGPLRWRVLRVA